MRTSCSLRPIILGLLLLPVVARAQAGTRIWTNFYVGHVIYDCANAVPVDNSGDVVVAGSSYGATRDE